MIPPRVKIKILALRRRFAALGSTGLNKFVNFNFLQPLLPEFFFSFSGHSLRQAFFVFRLIVATLIGNFFDDPS